MSHFGEGVMGNPPRGFLNGSQSARDQWFPIPLTHPAGAALYSIFKHMPTPKSERNSTWPLDILTSKQDGRLFNEDGSQWWLYISYLNSGRTALLRPVLTFVLILTDNILSMLSAFVCLSACVSFLSVRWKACWCVCFVLNGKICPRCRTCLTGRSAGKCQ